ncbi:Glucosidase 2 subunit beta [Thelohanellus kitauei]|uniref:Glucosidase 2 subunit beta n=1 Tax=Thelohanellus kitauei TaxID=669202 RepID=A0A0C2MKB9_THEKT|nr:Glucosidase 2 subunit beta [Thelohanellus kitauei]
MLKCLSLVVVLGLTRKFLADYIKGVSKEMQNLYQSTNGKFKCLNDGKEVPYVYVNDDYCDCSDGSDEPGTSACNNGIFWCQNTGHRQKRILSMDVGDKICSKLSTN